MKKKYLYIITFFLLVLSFSNVHAFELKGKLSNVSDSTYVSFTFINNLKDFFELGRDMVIRRQKVNSDGSFMFKGDELSTRNRFYRLSFSEGKNVIEYTTGKNRNNVCLYMNNESQISINARLEGTLIKKLNIHEKGDINNVISDLDVKVQSYIDKLFTNEHTLAQQRMIRGKAQDFISNYVDTCNYPILKYYLYSYVKGYDLIVDNLPEQHVKRIMKKNFPKSIYTKELVNRAKLEDYSTPWYYWFITSSFMIYSIIISFLFFRKNETPIQKPLLTVKEKSILKYISDGMLNKEIAEKMSIETTTVKSHISNLYKKLNIKNRAQAVDYYNNNKGV